LPASFRAFSFNACPDDKNQPVCRKKQDLFYPQKKPRMQTDGFSLPEFSLTENTTFCYIRQQQYEFRVVDYFQEAAFGKEKEYAV